MGDMAPGLKEGKDAFAIRMSISASSVCLLYFILLFWNQVLTCMSDSRSFSASSPRSAEERYFLSWNFFSSSATCSREKAVLVFFGLGGESGSSELVSIVIGGRRGQCILIISGWPTLTSTNDRDCQHTVSYIPGVLWFLDCFSGPPDGDVP